MRTSVSSKGQIVLPAEIRRRDGIKAGQEFKVVRVKSGDYRLIRQKKRRPNEGLIDLLRACPVKGFFVPIESESTESLWSSSPTQTS